MRNNLKIAVISAIGLLTLTVISAMTINSLPVVKAGCNGNCKDEAYGDLISSSAQTGKADPDDNDKNGYGDNIQNEVNPKNNKGIGQEFRQAGVNARGGDDAPGESGQQHGKNPNSNN